MRRTLLSIAVLVTAVLTGCGGTAGSGGSAGDPPGASLASEVPAPAPASRMPVPKPTPSPRDELADLAEQAATAVPTTDIAPVSGPVLGGDISWPQCPIGMGIPQKRTLGMPLPIPEARYVVIGLTNGPGFYANPCLADQVAWARASDVLVSAYAVASYPEAPELRRFAGEGPYDGSEGLGALRNVGYQQARFNIASMQAAGLETPIVWIDVEPVPDFEWSSDPVAKHGGRRGPGAGLPRRGLRDRRLLDPRPLGRRRGGPRPRGAGVARCRPDVARGGAEPLRRRLGDPGRRSGDGAVGRGRPRPERHVPGRLRRPRPVVPPVLTRRHVALTLYM